MSAASFSRVLHSIEPGETAEPRLIGLWSAAIALADPSVMSETVRAAQAHRLDRSLIHEIVLQSYLFLGFPRMLEAADVLHQTWPADHPAVDLALTADEANDWVTRGTALCRRVYGELYEPLRRKVESLAPEIFRWMVLEGYGKVLARPALSIALRELSIIAFLIVDNRPRQLHSHLRGALNCGTSPALIRLVATDLKAIAPDGYAAAQTIGNKLGIVV